MKKLMRQNQAKQRLVRKELPFQNYPAFQKKAARVYRRSSLQAAG
jgi:hypothetical protein